MGKRRKKNTMSGWWCGAYGQPCDWREPNRLQIGDTASEQVFFPTCGAPDGECDNMISALILVKNLMKCNKLGVVVKGLTEISKNRLTEALGGGQCKSVGHHG